MEVGELSGTDEDWRADILLDLMAESEGCSVWLCACKAGKRKNGQKSERLKKSSYVVLLRYIGAITITLVAISTIGCKDCFPYVIRYS